MPKNYPIKYKVISIILKLVILCSTILYIFLKISHQEYLDFRSQLANLFGGGKITLFLLAACVLMPVNWLLEAGKWKMLLTEIRELSLWKAFQSVCSGVTFAIFTPNRLGEFGGRILSLERGNRIRGALVSITGSLAQLLITIVTGSVGMILYFSYQLNSIQQPLLIALIVAVILVNALLILLFLNSTLLVKLLWNRRVFRKSKKYLVVFNSFSSGFLSQLLFLSFLRYCIFIVQFYFLLLALDVQVSFFQMAYLTSFMYLVAALVPTFALSEVAARGSLLIFLLGTISAKYVNITAAYFLLWMINLAVPALFGSIFLLNAPFFKTRNES